MRILTFMLLSIGFLYASDADILITNLVSPKNSLADEQLARMPDSFERPEKQVDTNGTIAPAPKIFGLKAIFENSALINGRWVKKGDRVDGYQVDNILADRVFLSDKGNKKTLYLFKFKGEK